MLAIDRAARSASQADDDDETTIAAQHRLRHGRAADVAGPVEATLDRHRDEDRRRLTDNRDVFAATSRNNLTLRFPACHDNTPPTVYLNRNWVLSEDDPVGKIVERVRAEDNEQDELSYGLEPSQMNYQGLLDQPHNRNNNKPLPFDINNTTGIITLNQTLKGRIAVCESSSERRHISAASAATAHADDTSLAQCRPDDGPTAHEDASAAGDDQDEYRRAAAATARPVSASRASSPEQQGELGAGQRAATVGRTGADRRRLQADTRGQQSDGGRGDRGARLQDHVLRAAVRRDTRQRRSAARRRALQASLASHQRAEQRKFDKRVHGAEQDLRLAGHVAERQVGISATQAKGSYIHLNLITIDRSSKSHFDASSCASQILHILGEGCFGQVWRCEAQGIEGSNIHGLRCVAVKTLKENATERERLDLAQELKVMKGLEPHPNVVRLLGCCTERDPLFIILEYVSGGKLQSFLRASREERNSAAGGSGGGGGGGLTSHQLTMFVYQVAKGMEYLASKGIIHRDLAARNVLIDEKRVCKVADFGFARDVAANQIYERKSEGRLPIRWMAPESLWDNIFSVKSDIWSFGVLIWEIVTLGSTPYPGLAAQELMKRVREGYRLERPEHCKRELYNIMFYCWNKDPSQRPSFTELVARTEELLLDETDYIELDRFPDHSYYNVLNLSGEKL
uniref:receptor protein-tyrosine kinase n=1 Tax=Trichogramma kaykai TaxID=54128 RepID=A0ABD2XGA0_9HYME